MEEASVLHIIEQIKNGDTSAFAILVDQYKTIVYSLCYKMTQSTEDAEDIAQETFVKAFQSLKSFKGKSKFSTWLYRIAYFTAINTLRKKRIDTVSDITYEPSSESEESLGQLISEERKKYLDQAITRLKPKERMLIILFYMDEHSIEEIAAITGLSVSNTKVKIHRTRKKLASILKLLLENEVHSLM